MSDRHELQSAGTHPAPCARHCESTAYEIEIRRLRHDIEHHVRIATEAIQEAEQLRTELAVSREREARMQWQPIETAPTDGARILLCGKGGKIADGYYGQPDGFANPKQFVWPYIHANPTHWMPLPTPPIAALAEGAQG